jgi:hypothetical protein
MVDAHYLPMLAAAGSPLTAGLVSPRADQLRAGLVIVAQMDNHSPWLLQLQGVTAGRMHTFRTHNPYKVCYSCEGTFRGH